MQIVGKLFKSYALDFFFVKMDFNDFEKGQKKRKKREICENGAQENQDLLKLCQSDVKKIFRLKFITNCSNLYETVNSLMLTISQ